LVLSVKIKLHKYKREGMNMSLLGRLSRAMSNDIEFAESFKNKAVRRCLKYQKTRGWTGYETGESLSENDLRKFFDDLTPIARKMHTIGKTAGSEKVFWLVALSVLGIVKTFYLDHTYPWKEKAQHTDKGKAFLVLCESIRNKAGEDIPIDIEDIQNPKWRDCYQLLSKTASPLTFVNTEVYLFSGVFSEYKCDNWSEAVQQEIDYLQSRHRGGRSWESCIRNTRFYSQL
jgi:hypothetical protein